MKIFKKSVLLCLVAVVFISCKENEEAQSPTNKTDQEQIAKQQLQTQFDKRVAEYEEKVETFLQERGCSYLSARQSIVCASYPIGSFDLQKDRNYVYSNLTPFDITYGFKGSPLNIDLSARNRLGKKYDCLHEMVRYANWYLEFMNSEERSAAISNYSESKHQIRLRSSLNVNSLNNSMPDTVSRISSILENHRENALTLMRYTFDSKRFAELWSEVKIIDALLADQTEERVIIPALEIRHVFKKEDNIHE